MMYWASDLFREWDKLNEKCEGLEWDNFTVEKELAELQEKAELVYSL